MALVKLKGKSLKGKNRIRENGPIYNVVKRGKFQDKPALFIENKGDLRWVELENDPDFEVIECIIPE